ncbi:MAG TPA: FHA domain-containing protein [Tepidisphaeraceae bacterium]|nr:FHA domain-containing protein [Tepidisphaeraceae bacterium]
MQVVLAMFRPDGERRSFSVVRDLTVIGRREDCDLRIPLGDISRKHCRLIKDGDSLRVEDLGSSNGTYHNGSRIQKEAILAPGDQIQVGSVRFVVQIDGVPSDEDLQAPPAAARAASPEGEDVTEMVPDDELASEAASEINDAEEDGAPPSRPASPSRQAAPRPSKQSNDEPLDLDIGDLEPAPDENA